MKPADLRAQIAAHKIELRPLEDLLPYAFNSRKHEDWQVAKIASAIKEFGWTSPVLIDPDGTIIAGHARVMAAHKLDLAYVPCIALAHLSESQRRALVIWDNQSATLSTWDDDMLREEALALQAEAFDLTLLGFDDTELAKILADPAPPPETKEDPDEPPMPTVIPKRAALGQLWRLGRHRLVCGNSAEEVIVAAILEDEEGHAIVTDPPYGLSFMGKAWDYDVPKEDLWRVWTSKLKPGGHVLSFSGTRTYHRMVVAMEDAGLEIRDQMQWLYGSGFPKSLDVSKAIDKAAGAEREVTGKSTNWRPAKTHGGAGFDAAVGNGPTTMNLTAPATDAARQWSGWGTALKPANEPICVARKPLGEDTVAANVLKHGTGGINVDAGRIGYRDEADRLQAIVPQPKTGSPFTKEPGRGAEMFDPGAGRFPANVLLDEEAAKVLDEQSGESKSPTTLSRGRSTNPTFAKFGAASNARGEGPTDVSHLAYGDSGGASRFFYVAKASKADRGEGNVHATVKPLRLMEYLVRLVTPPGGVVLEPFCGSGTTLLACETTGMSCRAAELDPDHVDIILARWEALTGLKAELEQQADGY